MTSTVNGRRHRTDVAATSASAASVPLDEDDATRKAILEVVQVWLDRLQLISVITTFFASIDGLLLGFMTSAARLGVVDVSTWSNSTQLMNASMAGALIFHVCAAITSFIGSFVLIRYKLLDAKKHEHSVEHSASSPSAPSFSTNLPDKPHLVHANTISATSTAPGSHRPRHRTNSSFHDQFSRSLDFLPSWTDIMAGLQGRVYINRVHIFDCVRLRRRSGDPERGTWTQPDTLTELEPPVKLLSRCHSLSAAMALCGFVLAVLGILAFVWTSMPQSIGIFTSVCLGTCFLSGVLVFMTS